jgi:hypothetical protein
MNEMNPSQQQRLADQLRRQAQSLDVGNTAIATVVSRGRQRRNRRRNIGGIVAVAALSGTAVGTIQMLSKPVSHKVVAGSDSVPTEQAAAAAISVPGSVPGDAALAPVTRVDSNMVWNPVQVDSTEALGGGPWDGNSISEQKPPFLVWSTVPGRATDQSAAYVQQLWRSDDGIHWQAAGEGSRQADVMALGSGARDGRLFAYGTAAATAAIPKGGGGDLVVDVSDDQGVSWQHKILPMDLRGLSKMKGVAGAGISGSFVVGKTAVVATAVPYLTFDSLLANGRSFALSRQGAQEVTYPQCSTDVTADTAPAGTAPLSAYPPATTTYTPDTAAATGVARTSATTTTMVGPSAIILGGRVPAGTSPLSTIVNADTADSAASAGASGASTTTIGLSAPQATVVPVTVVPGGPGGCTPEQLAPQMGALQTWSALGVDPAAVDAMFTTRVFVSTDGDTFTEGTLPPPPEGYQPGSVPQLLATDHGFVGWAQFYDAVGQHMITKLYTSVDGLTWSDNELTLGQIQALQVLPDGTLVAFGQDYSNNGYSTNGEWVASSADGIDWTKRSMSGLLEPGDGASAALNAWQMASGPSGITAIGSIDIDMAAEAGGFSIERDGVRLTLTESRYGSMVATDVAAGAELGRFDGRITPGSAAKLGYDANGMVRLLNDDGSVRVAFTSDDMQALYAQGNNVNYRPKSVILHSADGVNWSRDDVQPLVGFDNAAGGRIQVTASNVLVNIVEPIPFNADGTPTDPTAVPKTVVLVGTPKS